MTNAASIVLLIVATIVLSAYGQDEPDYSAELPRVKPLEPTEAIQLFEVLPGFHVELVAAEPLIASPVAVAFDEDARLYVVEMRDYSEHDRDRLGRIRLLEDTDGDGRMDRGSTFAEDLSWPTAITCWDGGVFVGAAPDLLYLKDTDGDGKADVRKTVFTGFARSNVQGLMNTFLWGLARKRGWRQRFHAQARLRFTTYRATYAPPTTTTVPMIIHHRQAILGPGPAAF